MRDKRAGSISQSDVFSVLIIGGLLFWYRREILIWLDEIFLSFFGKNLSGRNLLIQIAVYGLLVLLSLILPILLRRLIERKPKYRRAADGLILLILAIPAGQLLLICANQVLRRDDYWEIADARQYGFPGSMFVEIQRFNGRYTGWGLRSLHAVLPSIPYIDIFLFLNLILLTTATTLLCHRLLKAQSEQKKGCPGMQLQSFVMGFGLALAFVLMASNVFEFWFWGSGTMVYGFGISMCVLTAALVWNASETSSLVSRKMILPMITCFLTCGCSELCTASLAAFLIFLLIWLRIRDKKWNGQALFFIGEVVLCCILIFTGSASLDFSGTSAHIQGQTADHSAAGSLARIRGIFAWAFDGLQGYTFIKSRTLIMFLLAAFLMGTQTKFGKNTKIRCLVLSAALTIVAHAVLMINTTLDYMPPRVITVGICWYVTGMALVSFIAGSLLCSEIQGHTDRVKLMLCALLFMITMNSFFQENIGAVRIIRQSWYIRDQLIRIYSDSKEPLLTCALPSPGSSQADLSANPLDDFNIGTAQYYHLPEISAEILCPPYGDRFLPEDPYRDTE